MQQSGVLLMGGGGAVENKMEQERKETYPKKDEKLLFECSKQAFQKRETCSDEKPERRETWVKVYVCVYFCSQTKRKRPKT